MGDLVARFQAASVRAGAGAAGQPELLPVRLTRACTAVLPADGAGLSVFSDDYRVPLGASDDAAGRAERLQFTLGDGPCLEAARTGRAVVADAGQLEQRWSTYAEELFDRTPYRAVVSVALDVNTATRVALDLYLAEPAHLGMLSLADVSIVSEQVIAALTIHGAGNPWADEPEGAPLYGPATRERTYVWIAMGIVMTRFDLNAPDALALLRSYAYGRGSAVDDIAIAVVDGTLDVAELRP